MNAVLESLPVLVLYPHNRCNCRCVMCDIWKIDTAEEIGADELVRHRDDLKALRVEWVVFSGGEPLMHSDLFRLAALLRDNGIRTTVLSTGLLLKRYANRVVETIDDVIVSLDGPADAHDAIRRVPGAFRMLREGVEALHGIDPTYGVAARCTIQRGNFRRLRETARAAREIGLRSISFLAADLTSTAFNRPLAWPVERQATVGLAIADVETLTSEIDALIEEEGASGFVAESPEKLRRIVRHFRAHLGMEEPEAPRCNAPWVSAVLETDGTVRPCFFHEPLGNAREESLAAVINGPRAIHFRETLRVAENPICRRCVCSLYRT
jgi:MoaA/NifB/PqqE/SkfB family radical SAM enzyme